MNRIITHPNYKGLPIETKNDGTYRWVAPAKSEIGEARKKWAERKGQELGIGITYGSYADIMLQIHPFKKKPCQICGNWMSLYYLYPNFNFLNAINKKFNTRVCF